MSVVVSKLITLLVCTFIVHAVNYGICMHAHTNLIGNNKVSIGLLITVLQDFSTDWSK